MPQALAAMGSWGPHTGMPPREDSLLESRTHCQMEVHLGPFLGPLWGEEESGTCVHFPLEYLNFSWLWWRTEHLTNLLTPLDRTVHWHEVSPHCCAATKPLLSAPRTLFIETKTKSKTQEVHSHSIECFLPSLQALASAIPLSVAGNSTSLN